MAELTLVQAVNLALSRALSDDPDVVLFGQDIGIHGGVFRATEGLYQRFGGKRVIDTTGVCKPIERLRIVETHHFDSPFDDFTVTVECELSACIPIDGHNATIEAIACPLRANRV